MLLNILFGCIVFISVILVVFLFYNVYNLILSSFSSSKDTERARERITCYKRNYRISGILLILSMIFILIYTRPITFAKMIDVNNDEIINSASIWGNVTGGQDINVAGTKIETLENILSSYKYRRTFGTNNNLGEAVYLFTDRTVVEVYKNGYIRIPNYTIYKVNNKNKKELFNKLVDVIEGLE